MNLEDRLYSSSEVAEILGVSLRSIYRYLEDGKLSAEVKTATGRHRFTRQDILNFLYPDEKKTPRELAADHDDSDESRPLTVPKPPKPPKPTVPKVEVEWLSKFKAAQQNRMRQQQPITDPDEDILVDMADEEEQPQAAQSPKSEDTSQPVDWLARFKAAREELEKSKNQSAVQPGAQIPGTSPAQPSVPPKEPGPVYPKIEFVSTESAKPQPQPSQPPEPSAKSSTVDYTAAPKMAEIPKVDSIASSAVKSPAVEEKAKDQEGFFYYVSGVGGLKELAHSLNKSASTSMIPYGFTMYAGMSLYKSIKPFSILHVYIKPEHKSFFEKALQLRPADKNTAQLCLICSEDSVVFDTIKEMHGLRVVSVVKLRQDLLEAGEDEMAGDLDQIQG